jgi:hypothetical protein
MHVLGQELIAIGGVALEGRPGPVQGAPETESGETCRRDGKGQQDLAGVTSGAHENRSFR